ncbi:MAG: hypothetical protein C0598_04200 [Marinilabiliales bacterium]|nr:MAG: hypothetical protein C0598_04200 [Marinilabiliales bacterium]
MNSLKFKIFTFSFLVLLSFYSCSPNYLKGYEIKNNTDLKVPTIFNGKLIKALYKANLIVMGNELSGLLLLKKTNPSEYRIVFMSELGLKYFDFGVNYTKEKPEFTNYYLLSPMQRGEVEKILFNDLCILLSEFSDNIKYKVYRNNKTGDLAILNNVDEYNYVAFRYSGKDKIEKIQWNSKPEGRSMISINNYKGNLPSDLLMENSKYSLRLQLKLVEN